MEERPEKKDSPPNDELTPSGVEERFVAPAALVVLFSVVVVLILVAVAVHYRH